NADGPVTVCDRAPEADMALAATGGVEAIHEGVKGDGCDILWRIEQLQFTDQLVSVAVVTAPAVTTTPNAATPLAFGNQNVATTSASQNVTVQNTGSGPLTVTGLSIAGTDFAVSANTCLAAPIAAGGTCTVSVTFTPTAAGARSATLQIADNAAGSPHGVILTGTGVSPAPPPATFVFGSQTVQSVSDSNAAGTAEAFKVTSANNGTVNQLRVYVDTGTTGSL